MSTPSPSLASACAFSGALLVAAVLVCASCAGSLDDIDRFAPMPDAGAGTDAGGMDDAGAMDAGESGDAGEMDAGESDGGASDAGTDGGVDAGLDGGTHDAGTPDAGSDAGTPDAGPCNALATILTPTCATTFCHSSGTAQSGLDLQSAGLPGRLVGKASKENPDAQIINPTSPDLSVLYTKTISATQQYGSRMPLGGTPLTAAQQACLLSWIEGAVSAP